MGGRRTAAGLLSIVVGASLLTACGSASPLSSSATTTPSTIAVPASATTTTSAPATTTTTSSTSTTSTTVPTPPTTTEKGTAGLPYPLRYAHFSADFPVAPKKRSTPDSFGTFKARVYAAAAQQAKEVAEVVEEDISPDLPSAAADPALQTALKSITASSALVLKGQPAATTFRSNEAYAASYTLNGEAVRGLAFITDGGGRLYFILATSKIFDAFSASLRLTK